MKYFHHLFSSSFTVIVLFDIALLTQLRKRELQNEGTEERKRKKETKQEGTKWKKDGGSDIR